MKLAENSYFYNNNKKLPMKPFCNKIYGFRLEFPFHFYYLNLVVIYMYSIKCSSIFIFMACPANFRKL